MIENIAKELKNTLDDVRESRSIMFYEEDHKYTMLDSNGKIVSNYPSVSKLIDRFYNKFDSNRKAMEMVNGDLDECEKLLKSWREDAEIASDIGSRTHFFLEKKSLEMFGIAKNVRQPEFSYDPIRMITGDKMISAGSDFLKLMKTRGAWLIDTEVVMGSNTLKYFGQADSFWVIEGKTKGEYGIIITDYKTNKPKSFEIKSYTDNMLPPFTDLPNTGLHHYYVQLPLYGKLLIDMLQNTKFSNIKIYGYIIAHLKADTTFDEYRIPKNIYDRVNSLDFS